MKPLKSSRESSGCLEKTSSSISKKTISPTFFPFLSPHSFITVEAMGPNWARA